jgi:ComF family protein
MGLLRAVGDLLFPPACQVCRQPGEFPLCQQCRANFRLIVPPVCQKCGRPLQGSHDLVLTCPLCRRRRLRFARARAVAIYEGALREAILALKFGRCRPLASPLGLMMARCAAADPILASVRLIVPVPMHEQRRRERGFNQAELLAGEVGRFLGRHVLPGAIRRKFPTDAQSTLQLEKRWENVRDAFEASASLPREPVLLVDDVISTGYTASACACQLERAGAERVYVLAAALTLPEQSKDASPAVPTGLAVSSCEARTTS